MRGNGGCHQLRGDAGGIGGDGSTGWGGMKLSVLAMALAAMNAMQFPGCQFEREESYRYKLTLTVDTPEGIKSAFNVVEVVYPQYHPVRVTGDALYLDLGPGKRPLVALLTKRPNFSRPPMSDTDQDWEENRPTLILARLYGDSYRRYTDILELIVHFKTYRGVREITPANLPDLITFSNPNDSESVLPVDRNNLSASLDNRVEWRKIALELTDEPITHGLYQKLPWLSTPEQEWGRGWKITHFYKDKSSDEGARLSKLHLMRKDQ